MRKYSFSVAAVISLHVDVEADNVADAVRKAQDLPVMSLCHQCASGEKDEWSTSGELDTCPAEEKLVYVTVDGEEVSGRGLELIKRMWKVGAR